MLHMNISGQHKPATVRLKDLTFGYPSQLIFNDFSVTREVVEPDKPVVEHPEVIARQAQVRREAAGYHFHQLLARRLQDAARRRD